MSLFTTRVQTVAPVGDHRPAQKGQVEPLPCTASGRTGAGAEDAEEAETGPKHLGGDHRPGGGTAVSLPLKAVGCGPSWEPGLPNWIHWESRG